MSYIAVFKNSNECGPWRGIRRWTMFTNEEDFQGWYTPELQKSCDIIARGVTQEKAIDLVKKTPMACRYRATIDEAINKETGEIDIKELERKSMIYSAMLPGFNMFCSRYAEYRAKKALRDLKEMMSDLGLERRTEPEQVTAEIQIITKK